MAENTAVAEKKEAESRELVAKDFTEGMVVKIKQKEKFGLTFPKDYNYTNELMSAMLILQDTQDMNKKPVLQSCTRASIENALIEMVTYGLSIRKKQCYPVAYAGKLSCQPSVYGATCLARRYGLKDINASVIYKLIWENDIASYSDLITRDKKIICIEWNKMQASFVRKYRSPMGLQYLYLDEYIASRMEVIGNIFDNKELLESEE